MDLDPCRQCPQFGQVRQRAVTDKNQSAAEDKTLGAIGGRCPGNDPVMPGLRP